MMVLPEEVLSLLRAAAPRRNSIIVLLTVDQDQYPHSALLSPYQVLALSREKMAFHVHRGTRTAGNLSRTGKASLLLFLPPSAYTVKVDVLSVSAMESEEEDIYYCKVRDVRRDYSELSPITSEPTFDPTRVSEDYSRRYLKMLTQVSLN
ncbi:pyridoxamine 5'-phosphate oxidase family protein [Sulfodiicoccus acidiphilus]|nr:pyridoxamine 5'-phosphate oxidase family protein [Sulfodiicoccus acidiphilus]